MATPNYYDMMDAENRRLQAEQAAALKSDTGPQTVTTVEPKTQAEGGMGYLHGGATPPKDTEIPGATKTAAEIATGFTPAGWAIDVKDMYVALQEADPAGLAMAGFGFIPGLGDAGKAIFKAIQEGDQSAETLRAAKKIIDDLDEATVKRLSKDFTPAQVRGMKSGTRSYQCPVCGLPSRSIARMGEHMQNAHSKEWAEYMGGYAPHGPDQPVSAMNRPNWPGIDRYGGTRKGGVPPARPEETFWRSETDAPEDPWFGPDEHLNPRVAKSKKEDW